VDDPGLTTGKHRTVMNLPGFKASIIPFAKASDLKSELNKQFRCASSILSFPSAHSLHDSNKHPQLSSDLTLTKIRALKRRMLEASLEAVRCSLSLFFFSSSFLTPPGH
jgi:hypothetical protein